MGVSPEGAHYSKSQHQGVDVSVGMGVSMGVGVDVGARGGVSMGTSHEEPM